MKPPVPPRHGFLARASRRAKVLAAIALAVLFIFSVVAALVAGFALGYVLASSESKARCESIQGTWLADSGICEKAVEAAPAQNDEERYTCEDGATLSTKLVDPEVVHLTDQYGTLYVMPLTSLGNLGSTYSTSDGNVRISFTSASARYVNEEGGVDTSCELAGA